jgi:small subunit ribosomal protein S1
LEGKLELDKQIGENDSGLPLLDEGWWSAVLLDEEAQIVEKNEVNCAPCSQPPTGKINWECVKAIFLQDEVVLLQVYGFNRGGLLVQGEGIQGFVPISHLLDLPVDLKEEDRQQVLASYTNRSIYLKVIECEPSSERIVLSERAAQAGEGKRKQLFESLMPGAVACGVVTNITDFGVFVDLGGVEGLVHVSELSWGRVERTSDLFKIGQQVKVSILSINEGTSRIALSIKRLSPNPWENLSSSYQTGDVVSAQITSITQFGMFARLPEGIEGLIHISSLPEFRSSLELHKVFTNGQDISVKILHVDPDRRRLGLGLVADA